MCSHSKKEKRVLNYAMQAKAIDFKIKIHDVSRKHFKKKMQLEYDILDMQQYHKMNASIHIFNNT